MNTAEFISEEVSQSPFHSQAPYEPNSVMLVAGVTAYDAHMSLGEDSPRRRLDAMRMAYIAMHDVPHSD